MAQWSRADRTLYAKLVYYGPALGGKTTNLRALHAITDPGDRRPLLSLATSDDRTLFFDLLPFELGNILGYRVSLKLYTVPGQVRYETTRRVVLAGADGVVFVADSDPERRGENRKSWEGLLANLKANRFAPGSVPILVQYNKRDLRGALPIAEIARELGDADPGVPAIARSGEGVLETFVAASKAVLQRIVAAAEGRTRSSLAPEELARQIDGAFAPHLARAGRAPFPSGDGPDVGSPVAPLDAARELESAVAAGVTLADREAVAQARADRLDREAEALRAVSDVLRATGACFDGGELADATLRAACRVLGAARASLARIDPYGAAIVERTTGADPDPLALTDDGRALLRRLAGAGGPTLVDDLSEAPARVCAAPVPGEVPRILFAHAPGPERRFDESDLRFLATLASHLSAGFDKAQLWADLSAARDRLEETVRSRTAALRRAYEDLRSLDRLKDRFLSGVSHEMRTPITAIVGSAAFLRDYGGSPEERDEMLRGIDHAARTLGSLVDDLFRIAKLERGGEPLSVAEVPVAKLVQRAVEIAAVADVRVELAADAGAASADPERAARALANLLQNARKFSPEGAEVRVRVGPCTLRVGEREVPAIAFSVLDRGRGIAPEELERLFSPFQQGGDGLVGKPSGFGLGLYEARTLARRHGGLLRYAPRSDGGSEFRLVLPAVAPASGERRKAASAETGRG